MRLNTHFQTGLNALHTKTMPQHKAAFLRNEVCSSLFRESLLLLIPLSLIPLSQLSKLHILVQLTFSVFFCTQICISRWKLTMTNFYWPSSNRQLHQTVLRYTVHCTYISRPHNGTKHNDITQHGTQYNGAVQTTVLTDKTVLGNTAVATLVHTTVYPTPCHTALLLRSWRMTDQGQPVVVLRYWRETTVSGWRLHHSIFSRVIESLAMLMLYQLNHFSLNCERNQSILTSHCK